MPFESFALRSRRPAPSLALAELETRAVLTAPATLAFTFVNDTGLGSGVPVYVAMYGKENNIWGEFDLTGKFTAFTNSITQVTTYQLTGASTTVPFANDDPTTRIDSGRVVFGVGTPPVLSVNANNGGVNAPNLGNPTDPNIKVFYDFVEFTERSNDGTLFINTSTIDQLGLPLTVTMVPVDPTAPTGVGVFPDRADVFAAYTTFMNQLQATNPAAFTAYSDLVAPNITGVGTLAGKSYPYRVLAPKDAVQYAQDLNNQPYSSPLKSYFNQAITDLFATSQPLTLQVPNPNFGQAGNNVNPNDPQTYTLTGRPATVTATGSDGASHSYPVLQFTGTVAGQPATFNVYRPLFSTNGSAGNPPAPSWIPNSAESPGQMVLGCDGVFADNIGQFPGSAPNDSITSLLNLNSNLLANIENQLVSALNRGVSALPTTDWQDVTKYYAPTSTANFYSAFLHSDQISIGGKAYGFPYDDQAGQSSTMATADPQTVTVTLGAWAAASTADLSRGLLVSGAANGAAVEYGVAAGATAFTTPGTVVGPVAGVAGPVRVALADVNGDGVADRVTAAGVGGEPVVVVTDGRTGAEMARFLAFEATFTGGLYVTTGDLNRDGKADVVVSPDRGGGPVVAVFDGAKLAAGQNAGAELVRFLAIQDEAFRGGVRAAVGDVTGDGTPDLAAGAGFLGGPRVSVWDGADLAAGRRPALPLSNFFAFEQTLRNGVTLAVGDVTRDGKADLIFGGGPGGAPRVRVANGAEVLAAGGFGSLDDLPQATVASFYAGDPATRGGVRVVAKDVDGDSFADLVTGSGENLPTEVRVYLGSALPGLGGTPTPVQTFDPFAVVAPDGVYVG